MPDDQVLELLKGITSKLDKLESIDKRLTELEKKKAYEFDPAKLKASTKDGKLPGLRVVDPADKDKIGIGKPGGQLSPPWTDQRFPYPDKDPQRR